MCVQQQLDSNVYLPKLKRDYALAIGFPNSTSVESLEEGPDATLILSLNLFQRRKKKLCPLMFTDSQTQTYAPCCAIS